jgi:predicted CopG family antitoxin
MKLVEGRSTRRFSSETEVAEKLLGAGYEADRIYTKSLLSLTKLEKEIGKKAFSEVVGDLIEKPPGKLKLVPEEDNPPALRSSAEIDFKKEK